MLASDAQISIPALPPVQPKAAVPLSCTIFQQPVIETRNWPRTAS